MPCFFLPESTRGPRHLATRPGPLPLPQRVLLTTTSKVAPGIVISWSLLSRNSADVPHYFPLSDSKRRVADAEKGISVECPRNFPLHDGMCRVLVPWNSISFECPTCFFSPVREH